MSERWVVVGGGMLGLTLALRLAEAGRAVTVLEAADQVGGLAAAWTLDGPDGPITWDRHYHVTLLSDRRVRALLGELGLEASMEWVETKTGYFADGRLSSVSSSVDFVRLPGLSPLAKARLAATILHGSRVRDWRRLEGQSVEEWLTRWSGRATFARFWRPLLAAKLGASWRDANAAFIWATIQRLYAARRTGLKKEMFGYVPGGYARILARLVEHLESRGVTIERGAPVVAVEPTGDGLTVRTTGGGAIRADRVALTTTPDVAACVCPHLDDDVRRRIAAIRYQGIVCASLLLRAPLSPYYLTYVLDDMPFTAVVEMTAFVDPRHLGGHHLVYLPRYVAADDAGFEVPDDALRAELVPALRRMHPTLRDDDVLTFRVSRVRKVFPVPTIDYSRHVPAMDTNVAGLHLVTSAQIVNGTLNVEETVGLAEQAAARLLAPSRAGASG